MRCPNADAHTESECDGTEPDVKSTDAKANAKFNPRSNAKSDNATANAKFNTQSNAKSDTKVKSDDESRKCTIDDGDGFYFYYDDISAQFDSCFNRNNLRFEFNSDEYDNYSRWPPPYTSTCCGHGQQCNSDFDRDAYICALQHCDRRK